MAKKNNFENLRSLVLSLTPAEKRDFKKAASFWGDSEQGTRYLLLFDLLNEALRDDQKTGTTEFLARKKVTAKFTREQLGETSNTLYLNLLKNLRGHAHVGRSRREVQNCLSNIHFLYHKRLFDAAWDWVERGKSLCEERDLHYYKMELLFWERKLLFAWKIENFEARTELVASAEKLTAEKIKLETTVQAMFSVFRRIGYSNSASTVEKINEQIQILEKNHDQWKADLVDSRFGTRMLNTCAFNATRILLRSQKPPSTFLGKPLDHQLRLDLFEEVIENMEKENTVEDDPHVFYRSVSDYIAGCIQLGELKRAEIKEHLLPDDPKSPDFLEFTIYARLLLFFKQKNYAAGKKFIVENKLGNIIDDSNGKIATSRHLFICFYAALIAYKCNDFTLATEFFKRMDAAAQKGPVPALTIVARTVEVFIEVRREVHLKMPDYYEKIVRNLRTMLEEGGHYHGFHKTLCETLQKLSKSPRPVLGKDFFEKLRQESLLAEHAQMWQILVDWLTELPY